MLDTIAAIATPQGSGGVAIIRLSGKKAHTIAESLCQQRLPQPRLAYYRTFYDHDVQAIDMGLVLYFQGPASFTGEDVVEIHGHGGVIVSQLLLARVLALGARAARPGEFSERAFLNGKIDLVAAEAIADLINSDSAKAAQAALRSLQGEFSKRINIITDELISLRVFCEATLDFPEDEIDLLENNAICARIQRLAQSIASLLSDARQGARLRSGLTVAIIGAPNAGKSSLLNALSGEESAIVTPIAGTTRDVVRERIVINGLPIHICDTAGLRETEDLVEKEGIDRAYREMRNADRILLLCDVGTLQDHGQSQSQSLAQELQRWQARLLAAQVTTPLTFIVNKIDLADEAPKVIASEPPIIYISAKNNIGITLIRAHLFHLSGLQNEHDSLFMARERHLMALIACQQAVELSEGK